MKQCFGIVTKKGKFFFFLGLLFFLIQAPKTKLLNLANRNKRNQCIQPIRTRIKSLKSVPSTETRATGTKRGKMQSVPSAGKNARQQSHDWLILILNGLKENIMLIY